MTQSEKKLMAIVLIAIAVYALSTTEERTTLHGLSANAVGPNASRIPEFVAAFPCLKSVPAHRCIVPYFTSYYYTQDALNAFGINSSYGPPGKIAAYDALVASGRVGRLSKPLVVIEQTQASPGSSTFALNAYKMYWQPNGSVQAYNGERDVQMVAAQSQGGYYDLIADRARGTRSTAPVTRQAASQRQGTIIGMSEATAIAALNNIGYSVWELSNNGVRKGLPVGSNPKRVNIDVVRGLVKAYYVG